MRTDRLYILGALSIAMAVWTLDFKMQTTVTVAAITGCAGAATFGPLAMAIACTASGILAILHGFTINWKTGNGDGVIVSPVKRENWIKTKRDNGEAVSKFSDLAVGEWAQIEVLGNTLDVKRMSNNTTGLRYRPGNVDGDLEKREAVTEIWGVGEDVHIDKGQPLDQEFHTMARNLAIAYNGQGGTACSTVKDGNEKVFDIKFVMTEGNTNPGGNTCGV